MASVSTNDFKNGMTLEIDGDLWKVVEFQHVKPGKGPAFVRTKMKNVRAGAVVDRTFRAGESVERAVIDKREKQYLYRDADGFVFMDNETYEQASVPETQIDDAANYLVEGSTAVLLPVKAFDQAKARLAAMLDPTARAAFAFPAARARSW